MIGLFINTLPVRVKVVDDQSIVEFLTRLQDEQVARDAFAHAPLVEIQRWSQVAAPDPLFESVVVFENYPMDESLGQVGGPFTVGTFELFEQTNLPITLMTAPAGLSAVDGSCTTALRFDAWVDRPACCASRTLARESRRGPGSDGRRLADDARAGAAADCCTIGTIRETPAARPGSTLARLFEAQVARTPSRVAASVGERKTTYEELNQRANQAGSPVA